MKLVEKTNWIMPKGKKPRDRREYMAEHFMSVYFEDPELKKRLKEAARLDKMPSANSWFNKYVAPLVEQEIERQYRAAQERLKPPPAPKG